MIEDGSPILAKNTAGTLTFRNQADDADLVLVATPAAHTHALTAGATDVTATATELNKLAGTPAGLTATELGYVDGVTSSIQTQLNARGPTTKTDRTASYSLGSVYQNTGTTPMFVSISVRSSSSIDFRILSDASNPPTTINAEQTISATTRAQIHAWVMPGEYYKAYNFTTGGTQTVDAWIEMT